MKHYYGIITLFQYGYFYTMIHNHQNITLNILLSMIHIYICIWWNANNREATLGKIIGLMTHKKLHTFIVLYLVNFNCL